MPYGLAALGPDLLRLQLDLDLFESCAHRYFVLSSSNTPWLGPSLAAESQILLRAHPWESPLGSLPLRSSRSRLRQSREQHYNAYTLYPGTWF
jgi:hypothetical protein